MYGYIYETTNLVNGKKYIGQRKFGDTRLYLGSGIALKRAIKKYGPENFVKQIMCECGSKEELDLMEIHYIAEANAVKSDLYYNIAIGGNAPMAGRKHSDKTRYAMCGKHHSTETKQKIREKRAQQIMRSCSEETKRKISESQIGRIFSDEHKKNISQGHRGMSAEAKKIRAEKIANANTGKQHSDEHKQKISKALKGIQRGPVTDEHRQHMSEARKGKKYPIDRESREKRREAILKGWETRRLNLNIDSNDRV